MKGDGTLKELFNGLIRFDLKVLFKEQTTNTFIQFFRYIFVGGFAFLVDALTLWICEKFMNYMIAAVYAAVYTVVKGSNIRKEVRFGGIFVWALLVASFIQFNISYPYLCTADFRYISVTAVAGAVFMAYAMQLTRDTKMCEVLKFLSVAFAVCSAAVYI